ncbi:hypothetical protein F8388_002993 [Cannabis sativa]|uniref:6-phosphogluconate dehydrogenase NADP-binding domain-containing protein n=1 Tax=Cannabis sativa TaxID=3483 RepID=A0A7J6H5B7_CANSA|nr:hypothetical protein F8388_002993 [Cannabis sativa]
MCSHLIKAGYTLTVFNRTLSKAQPLLDMGAHLAHSPQAVAAQSDVVFSIVGYPSDVRSVLLDPSSGALAGLISSSAAAKGCAAIDAPVSGGDLGARNGTLAIFAGGDESVVNRLNPLFNHHSFDNGGLVRGNGVRSQGGTRRCAFLEGDIDWRGWIEECQNMSLALPGLALAQQLYVSLKAHGEGNLGTQALILALERLNNVSLESSVTASAPAS